MTNKPAQVTSHWELARKILNECSHEEAEKLIADSEERAVAEAERRMDEEEFKPCSALCDQLRDEAERLTTNCTQLQESCRYHEARAERAEAELAKERARLDFMNTRGFEHRHHETGDWLAYEWTITSAAEHKDVNLRDTIDAAMKEESK